MKKVKFAIIGFGYIGRHHAEIIKGHPDCQLGAVSDLLDETADLVPAGIPFLATPEK